MRLIMFTCVLLTTVACALATDATEQQVSLRIRFGMKDKDGQDWSGKLTPSDGSVQSIRGWRWMPGDKSDGSSWIIATRRPAAQSAAEKKQIATGRKLAVQDNGFVTTLIDVKPDTTVAFESQSGKANFKLSDVPLGKPLLALDGNLQIERVPTATELAGSNDDEDYPAVARAKNGTLYVAYLSFTHGKDFQGARERPATPESGPVSGPLATGQIRKIEKPQDLDYLAEPVGGEQVHLRTRGSDGKWSDAIAVTDGKHELYRPAIAIDGSARVWVFYSAHLDPDENLDHGNWELMARSFDAKGGNPSDVVNISNAPGADFMPAATTDSEGKTWVTWVGGREKNFNVFVAGQQDEKTFSKPQRLTDSAANEWETSIAADDKGHLTVAWDTYAKGDYDVYLAQRNSGTGILPVSFGKPQPVAATAAFEVRPSMAYDKQGQLWIAWEESGDQWGKDFGALKKKGIPLYTGGRSLAVKALDKSGQWLTTPDLSEAMPLPNRQPRANRRNAKAAAPATAPTAAARQSNPILPSFPRISISPDNHVYLAFRGRPGGQWRVPVGSVWSEFVTRLDADGWTDAVYLPRSNNILDNRPAVAATKEGFALVYSGDGRAELNPSKLADPHLPGAAAGDDQPALAGATDDDAANASKKRDANAPREGEAPAEPASASTQSSVLSPQSSNSPELVQPAQGRRRNANRRPIGNEINDDLYFTVLRASDFPPSAGAPALAKTDGPVPATPSDDTVSERAALKSIRDFRITLNGETLRIWRGEFHRHTELSPDGGNDGGLLDMWRYALDAVDMDWIGDGDHDYGNGREYSWWTTQKAVTLFTLPGRFTPVFSYERSVAYPEGHRNCMFAQRGVRSLPRLPITSRDKEAPAPDTNMFYMYLHHFKGLCASHTSATGMGTDWRNNDPEVEPFVEIYQGDRNNYERPDSPRSAVTEAKIKNSTPEKESLGGWEPKGFVNLALLKGYRLAFQSSSDHISTHLSYCNVLIPADKEPSRQAILDAVRKRRVYGATDNIIADVRCKVGDKYHLMGEEFTTNTAPTLNIHIIGAQKIAKVTIIKDDQEVLSTSPDKQDVTMTWTDPASTAGKTSYYYVRAEQVPDMEGVTSGELVWASPMWIKYQP